jgi:hypothetical protein
MKSMALMSVELVNASATKDLNARVRSFRSSTKWFTDAKYGVFLQWGQGGYPAQGDKKKWPQMIDDFDVEKFADTMQDIGAGYVIWSATWRNYYFPAPIKTIDNILPGRTSRRDLIGELIGALGLWCPDRRSGRTCQESRSLHQSSGQDRFGEHVGHCRRASTA